MTPNTIAAITELTYKVNAQPTPKQREAKLDSSKAADTPAAPPANPQQKTEAAGGQPTKTPERSQLDEQVKELNERYRRLRNTGLRFSIDEDAGELVVKVMDMDKDKVIRQIPSQDFLEMAVLLKEQAEERAGSNQWTALAERGTAPKIPTAGRLLNAKA